MRERTLFFLSPPYRARIREAHFKRCYRFPRDATPRVSLFYTRPG